MKRLLFILSVVIIIVAVLSILINHSRKQAELRVINLIRNGAMNVSVNDFTFPYPLQHGTSSSYISLPHIKTNAGISLSFNDKKEINLQNIFLSPDSLNTVIITGNQAEADFLRAATPKMINYKRTALRYIINPDLKEEVTIEIAKDDFLHTFSPSAAEVGNYTFLDEDFYELKVNLDGEEFIFRVFLEKGEFYSLVLLAAENEEGFRIRLFVDNKPGDQYITPALQDIR